MGGYTEVWPSGEVEVLHLEWLTVSAGHLWMTIKTYDREQVTTVLSVYSCCLQLNHFINNRKNIIYVV